MGWVVLSPPTGRGDRIGGHGKEGGASGQLPGVGLGMLRGCADADEQVASDRSSKRAPRGSGRSVSPAARSARQCAQLLGRRSGARLLGERLRSPELARIVHEAAAAPMVGAAEPSA